MSLRSSGTRSCCLLLSGVLALGAFCSLGCTRPKAPEVISVEQHLRAIGVAYGRYSAQHRGESPADEASFRKFLTDSPDMLKMMNVESVDELFKSARDNETIVMRYGVPAGIPGQSKDVIAYEAKGRDGKRFVVFAGGKMQEVDESAFKQLVPSAGS